ncbi:MAG: alpha/beta hydrolase [Alphaproteobacteria bacterium]|nr:alpha/beta hydrolase [Alphaproteobacteria bacterium]MCW5740540.1 alpha/beta hydrolase [Alphaproteobacteria bacterium]
MPELRKIATKDGLTFDAWIEGPQSGDIVLLLHGFPQSRHTWRAQVPALAAAGYRAIAPDQRGYSPGARPDPADLANYSYSNLVWDGLNIIEACGGGTRRFHLVGHDWGGQVSWGLAAWFGAERLASLSILSRPHPTAFARALQAPDNDQKHRSRHHRAFLNPDTTRLLTEDDARRLRRTLADAGVPAEAVELYVSVIGAPEAMEAALAWYRAQKDLRIDLQSPITVPTLYVWGDADHSVSRMGAEGTAACVSGPYRFVSLPGIGHFATDQVPDRINELLLEHIGANPA